MHLYNSALAAGASTQLDFAVTLAPFPFTAIAITNQVRATAAGRDVQAVATLDIPIQAESHQAGATGRVLRLPLVYR
ncbi:MAG: hypothetical protein R2911_27475 [Caldilineaceae bacterium]